MRINQLALIALPLGGSAFVPAAVPVSGSALKASGSGGGDWLKPVMAAAAGLTIASQSAFGLVSDIESPVAPTGHQVSSVVEAGAGASSSPTLLLSAFGSPSAGGGSSFETLDFSLPSYSEATGASADTKSAPAFDPFGAADESDSEEAAKKEKQAAKEAKEKQAAEKRAQEEAERKAAAEKRAQDKADREAEKAAAEAKKAEEKAAAEAAKAEKEARRKAQAELMRQAVERSAEKKAEEMSAAEPVLVPPPVFEPPKTEIKPPELKVPDFEVPKFEAPKFDAPKFEAPKFDAPKFEAPKFDAPKFEAPAIPKLEAPKTDFNFDIPTPKVAAPEVDEDIEPQEVRDERAREAKRVFKDADDEAKAAEAQARALRDAANEKKKVAQAAKDEACKTRWGGKILCLRPFGTGY